MAATITPPGKGRIVLCPDCNGTPDHDCLECRGEGLYIRRACPRCGDPGWDYVNGTDDRDGMACRISCGYRWTADDPAGAPKSCPPTRCKGQPPEPAIRTYPQMAAQIESGDHRK
jgi:hypothetical protein